MEVRKVQSTGGSSFVITLPKEWILSQNIKKNDPLGLMTQTNGTLLITPTITGEALQRVKRIDVSIISEDMFLFRQLIGSYIAGFNNIIIVSKKRIPPYVRSVVRTFTTMTIGQEVVEETDTSISLKDLLDPTEMPFEKTIKRMHIIVKGMYEDTIRAVQIKDKSLIEDVISRDNDVDRLHWLVARQYNIILQNLGFAEKMKTTIKKSSSCFLISRIIERIGDHVVHIAQNISKIMESDLESKVMNQIISTSADSIDIFQSSINSFFKKDLKSSNKTINSVKDIQSKCEQINALALQHRGDVAITIGYLVESIRRIGEYAEDISETVINYLIEEEK